MSEFETSEPLTGAGIWISRKDHEAEVAALRAERDEALRLLRTEHDVFQADPGCSVCAFLAAINKGETE